VQQHIGNPSLAGGELGVDAPDGLQRMGQRFRRRRAAVPRGLLGHFVVAVGVDHPLSRLGPEEIFLIAYHPVEISLTP
jgi:hypothetical protein